eukprot:8325148-Pyramimonas_sp.AAC.1
MLYLYLGEWNPRAWDMSEVYNPMYPTSSHPKIGGALNITLFFFTFYGSFCANNRKGALDSPDD